MKAAPFNYTEWGVFMDKRMEAQVKINGREYTISGYEKPEYLKKVAEYIDSKYAQFKKSTSNQYIDNETKNILMHINIADDYFKLKEKMDDASYLSETRSNEIFDLKHEIISLQTKLELANKEIEELKAAKLEEEKKNVRLETRLAAKLEEKKNGE